LDSAVLGGRVIVGTAGHIDHGKSALVTALTGRSMDRLAEERRRGITIDLNFAPLPLGADLVAGMVDVPGHEDFVRTMVAGASGIDLALLVVAADEGIMPQTVEHLAVLEQLGVRAAIPVLTKADLVEPEWLELVMTEVAQRLATSPVAFEAPIAVSAKTGQGIEELRSRLAVRAAELPARSAADLFRLPVDRAFSVAGVGTVVTGTAWSGRLAVGDPVLLLPDGREGRVRSIESYGCSLARSEPGARTALGIAGIERGDVRRGSMVVTPDSAWLPTTAVDVEIALQPEAPRPLANRTRVRFHLGTAEVMARVIPRSPIEPGGSGLARLRLEEPVVARGQDRFVLRSYSPVATIGGGRVLDPQPPRRRSVWPLELASRSPAERFRALLDRHPGGLPVGALPVLLGVPRAAAGETASREASARLVGELWVRKGTVEALATRALEMLKAYHRSHMSDRGMPLETLRRSLKASDRLVEAALADLAAPGRMRLFEGLAALAGFAPRVAGGEEEIDRIVGLLETAQLSPPSLAELQRQSGRTDVGAVLRLAAVSGRVEAVERDRYYTRGALDQFIRALVELGQEGDIVPAALRDRLGISRKYLIPLLEWADGRGITVRVGDVRHLRNA
jgi:selenocysteine-specific elongation factor